MLGGAEAQRRTRQERSHGEATRANPGTKWRFRFRRAVRGALRRAVVGPAASHGGILSPEVWAVLGVGVALAGLILRMGQRLDGLARDVSDLRERMARLEGLIEGWWGVAPGPEAAS